MKTVVITGSARGLGYEMAKCFRKRNYNVIISDILVNDVNKAEHSLTLEKGAGSVLGIVCDITKENEIKELIKTVIKKFKSIDIWINNAGVNQPDKMLWELSSDDISRLIDIDLKGTIIATKYIMEEMSKNNSGSIYFVEGHGSNNKIIPGLSMYGTTKRGVTYFADSLAKEVEEKKLNIMIGKLSPGIMITDFIVNSFRDKKIILSEKNKKAYNILGDYPSPVAKFLVKKIVYNTDNNVRFSWLTTKRVLWKFIKRPFNKKDYFKKEA